MVVCYIAASNASILCSSIILLTTAWDCNCALCCYYENNFRYVNCKTRGIIDIHCLLVGYFVSIFLILSSALYRMTGHASG